MTMVRFIGLRYPIIAHPLESEVMPTTALSADDAYTSYTLPTQDRGIKMAVTDQEPINQPYGSAPSFNMVE